MKTRSTKRRGVVGISLGIAAALCLFIAQLPSSAAAPMSRDAVPEPLAPWVDWVLRGEESAGCPFDYFAFDQKRCYWPGRLRMEVNSTSATFEQEWQLHVEGWIPLPGNDSLWPQDVRVNGSPAVVLGAEAPWVLAAPGRHTVTGRLSFDRVPEFIQVPAATGLVDLRISGKVVKWPELDRSGRLWISADGAPRAGAPKIKNTLELRVFRRILDGVPLTVATRLELDVSGENRELLIGPVLLQETIPMWLNSELPARLEPDGRLRIQVRQGRWKIDLQSRHPNNVTELRRGSTGDEWVQEEIWVFEAQNHIRLAQIEGVSSVEPRQTSLPQEWQQLPAYRVAAGDVFKIVVRRRGDVEPESDQLALQRTLWLDFDGGGYTVNDRISGQLSRSWRIEAQPVLELGRVAVDSEPWFITRREGSEKIGVELRRGDLDLSADSRIAARSELPAVGWDQDFQSVRAQLNVPPGWRLLSTSGVDRVNDTWISRWTLFDLFLILIIAAVAGRLWGLIWGLVALAAIGLVFHETDAPRHVWLHVFAATALLRVLPIGNFSRWVRLYRNLALVALAVIFLPFAVSQVRVAFFPQLERPWQSQLGIDAPLPATRETKAPKRPAVSAAQTMVLPESVLAPTERNRADDSDRVSQVASGEIFGYRGKLAALDPKATIQTGPGLPRWQWDSVDLIWNGPVARDQSVRLWLLSPAANFFIRILSVVLLALLALRALDLKGGGRLSLKRKASAPAAAIVLGAVALAGLPNPADADAFPDKQILEELRARLTQAPECATHSCASLPRMRIDVVPDSVTLRMEVHAAAPVAVPLPGRHEAWLPETVQVDGIDARGVMRRNDGTLWVSLEAGTHQLVVSGRLPAREQVEIALPFEPHRAEVSVDGWEVDGVYENGLVSGQIQLRRIRDRAATPEALEPGALPPFVRVERTLSLGLEWRVFTRVVRVAPRDGAVVLDIPLIEGESITTDGIRVENSRVQVNLGAGLWQIQWESVLPTRGQIELSAPEVTSWTEIWRLDASPIWHVETAGIPVIHQQQQGQRFPQWQPWPGESVTLTVSRPEGVPGKTLTIDASDLSLRPGQRATDAELRVKLRSSQGVQHPLTLPEGAKLQSVAVDGRSQPIRQDQRVVTVPLTPGEHEVKLGWRTARGMSAMFPTPEVDLGAASVNASVEMSVPQSRWVLFAGGPSLGPAVMFWGLLIIIIAVAVALGRTGRTPLKTRHWLLLGLGLSQIPVYLAIVVVGWLFALDWRRRLDGELKKWQFNLTQIGLALLTAISLGLLFYAVQQGLLGLPDMQIGGNGSVGYQLKWFDDRSSASLPEAWVFSVPLTVYRLLMLAWALWIAFALVAWLKWGWACFSSGGYWRSITLGRPKRSKPHVTFDLEPEDSADSEPKK